MVRKRIAGGLDYGSAESTVSTARYLDRLIGAPSVCPLNATLQADVTRLQGSHYGNLLLNGLYQGLGSQLVSTLRRQQQERVTEAGAGSVLQDVKDFATSNFGSVTDVFQSLKDAAQKAGNDLGDVAFVAKLKSVAQGTISQSALRVGLSVLLYDNHADGLLQKLNIQLPAGAPSEEFQKLLGTVDGLQKQYVQTFEQRVLDAAQGKSQQLHDTILSAFNDVRSNHPEKFAQIEKVILDAWTQSQDDITAIRTVLVSTRNEFLGKVAEEAKKHNIPLSLDDLSNKVKELAADKFAERPTLDFLKNSPLRSKADEIVALIQGKLGQAHRLAGALKGIPEIARNAVGQANRDNCGSVTNQVIGQYNDLATKSGTLVNDLAGSLQKAQDDLEVEEQKLATSTVSAQIDEYYSQAASARTSAAGEERLAAAALLGPAATVVNGQLGATLANLETVQGLQSRPLFGTYTIYTDPAVLKSGLIDPEHFRCRLLFHGVGLQNPTARKGPEGRRM